MSWDTSLLANLYAELPGQDQWPDVCRALDQLAADPSRVGELMDGEGSYHSKSREMIIEQLLLFSDLLDPAGEAIEPRMRKLLKLSRLDSWRHQEALGMLFAVSNDREATTRWLVKELPQLLKPEVSSGAMSRDEKAEWEQMLADGRVEEGIKGLQKAAAAEREDYKRNHLLNHQLKLGMVLDRKELAKDAADQLLDRIIKQMKSSGYASAYEFEEIMKWHAWSGNWQAIVDLYVEVMSIKAAHADSHFSPDDFGRMDGLQASYLTALHQLGRKDDFGAEFAKVQQASGEVPEAFFYFLCNQATGEQILGVRFLQFLKQQGRNDEAWSYGVHLLARNPGVDDFYDFLYGLDPAKALSFIESIRRYDPYEERPLIWMAEIARRGGDLGLAQQRIDEAIALDPSDGDHGKHSRMYCYEVLAAIHADAGRVEKAAFFRSVVDSIRRGEEADDYLDAGLISEATKRYEQALQQFNDAYCLQSRLAMTLARNGRFEESVAHFEKAFELMPVSFGPRESHCFGCEGLFSDPRVLEIALPVIREFEKKHPHNARAPYMLGLILEQKRESEQAAIAYEKALELDPSYYNAALKLLAILEKDPRKQERAAGLREKMFELAPYQEKPGYLPMPHDLRGYWVLVEAFPASPLELPAVPHAVKVSADAKTLYRKAGHNLHSMGYWSDGNAAIDGWSKEELCRRNAFLVWLDDLE